MKKFLHYIILFIAIIVLNFFLPRFMPGTPISSEFGANMVELSTEQRQIIMASFNLDKPLSEQFLLYIKDIFTLNWGVSYSKKQPIFSLLQSALPWTLLLCGTNLVLSTFVGSFLGALSAFLRKRKKDVGLVAFMTVLGTPPAFWVGMVLIAVFGVKLKWFPIYGAYSAWGNYGGFASFVDVLNHLVLPVLTLMFLSVGVFFTTARYSVLNILEQDFVKMAQVRGISSFRVNFFYVCGCAIIPVFAVFMTELGFVLSGAVVIEKLFSYPGIGLLMYDAVVSRDYPLMQFVFLITSVTVVFAAFLADIMQTKIDPTLKVNEGVA